MMVEAIAGIEQSPPEASSSAVSMDVEISMEAAATARKENTKKRKRSEVTTDQSNTPKPDSAAFAPTDGGTPAESSKSGAKAVASAAGLPEELEIDLKAPTPLSKAEARQARHDAKKAKKEGKEKPNKAVEAGSGEKSEGDHSDTEPSAKKSKRVKKDAGADDEPAKPKRANSIWIGNLNFRSTSDGLREWFTKMILQGSTGVGDIPPDATLVKALSKIKGGADKAITRVNLPTKPGKGRGMIPEGKGFAYVDFASKEIQAFAVGLSEKVFGGRKVLIKLGDDHAPTPDARTPKPLSIIAGALPPASKLGANPPSSSLFVGNLAFDTNEVELREHVEREVGRARGFTVTEAGEDEGGDDAADGEVDADVVPEKAAECPMEDDDVEVEEAEEETEEPTARDILHGDQKGKDTKTTSKITGLKKVRMPLFEDSGRCKGFAFLDFESPEFATFALAQRPLMFFKGKKLVLQYASEASTKRSLPAHKRNADKEKEASFGNTPSSRGGFSSRGGGRGGYNGGGERRANQSDRDGDIPNGGAEQSGESDFMKRPERKPRVERPSFGAPGGAIGQEAEGRGSTRGKKWEATGRPRPGAALAMAKRQNVSIVAGQGKKVTFD